VAQHYLVEICKAFPETDVWMGACFAPKPVSIDYAFIDVQVTNSMDRHYCIPIPSEWQAFKLSAENKPNDHFLL